MRFILVVNVFMFVTPMVLFAQGTGLTQCIDGASCNFCDLANTIDAVIRWLVMISILIATIGLAYAGFRMSASRGNPQSFFYAKTLFSNIIIGIFIVMAAWMIVDTILKSMAGGDLGVWNAFDGDCGGAFSVNENINTEVNSGRGGSAVKVAP